MATNPIQRQFILWPAFAGLPFPRRVDDSSKFVTPEGTTSPFARSIVHYISTNLTHRVVTITDLEHDVVSNDTSVHIVQNIQGIIPIEGEYATSESTEKTPPTIIVNSGLWGVELVNSNTALNVFSINRASHPFRQLNLSFPSIDVKPSILNTVNIEENGIGIYKDLKVYFFTVIVVPQFVRFSPSDTNQTIFVLGPSQRFTNIIRFKRIYTSVPSVPIDDPGPPPDDPDITPEPIPQGDYGIVEFSNISPVVKLGGFCKVFIRVRNNSNVIPTKFQLPRLVVRQLGPSLHPGSGAAFLGEIAIVKRLNAFETIDFVAQVQIKFETTKSSGVTQGNAILIAVLENPIVPLYLSSSSQLFTSFLPEYDNISENNISNIIDKILK